MLMHLPLAIVGLDSGVFAGLSLVLRMFSRRGGLQEGCQWSFVKRARRQEPPHLDDPCFDRPLDDPITHGAKMDPSLRHGPLVGTTEGRRDRGFRNPHIKWCILTKFRQKPNKRATSSGREWFKLALSDAGNPKIEVPAALGGPREGAGPRSPISSQPGMSRGRGAEKMSVCNCRFATRRGLKRSMAAILPGSASCDVDGPAEAD